MSDTPPVSCSREEVCLSHPELGDAQIRQLCVRLLPGWSCFDAGTLQVDKMSGGISNLLVKVSPPVSTLPDRPRPVAVKVFGQKTELLIDREAELRTLLQLNRAGFGAKVVAVFGNGRMEEFMNAYTLTPQDMSSPLFVPRIAQRLRQLHEVRLEGGDDSAHTPQLFQILQSWLHMAQGLQFEDAAKQRAFEQMDVNSMAAEVSELQRLCTAAASPVVFSHNDLLSGNILVLQEPHVDVSDPAQVDLHGPLQLIDFEYSTPSYRGFDIGNHFNEYAGFDCDYSRYPGPEAQALFFKHYITQISPPHGAPAPSQQQQQQHQGQVQNEHACSSGGGCDSRAGGNAPQACSVGCCCVASAVPAQSPQSVNHDPSQGPASQAGPSSSGGTQHHPQQGGQLQGSGTQSSCSSCQGLLDRLSAEANLFALASHAYWGIWALVQARYSPIDFDYLDYSGLRWAEYHRRKPGFIADARRALGIS